VATRARHEDRPPHARHAAAAAGLLISRGITAIVFAALTLAVLFPFAYIAGGVRLEAEQWFTLSYRVLLGSIPLSRSVSRSATCPGQLGGRRDQLLIISQPQFASGLFFPKQLLPPVILNISPYLRCIDSAARGGWA